MFTRDAEQARGIEVAGCDHDRVGLALDRLAITAACVQMKPIVDAVDAIHGRVLTHVQAEVAYYAVIVADRFAPARLVGDRGEAHATQLEALRRTEERHVCWVCGERRNHAWL